MRNSFLLLVLLLLLPSAVLAATLTGQVFGPDGQPVEGAMVGCRQDGPFPADSVPSEEERKTAGDGSFAFDAVPDGRFRLRASAPGFGEVQAPVPVRVAGLPVAGLSLRLAPPR